jgi:hypothetical protein
MRAEKLKNGCRTTRPITFRSGWPIDFVGTLLHKRCKFGVEGKVGAGEMPVAASHFCTPGFRGSFKESRKDSGGNTWLRYT